MMTREELEALDIVDVKLTLYAKILRKKPGELSASDIDIGRLLSHDPDIQEAIVKALGNEEKK